MAEKTISYPFGAMDIQSIAYAASIEIPVTNQKTLVEVAEMTGAVTLTADISEELYAGAELIVKLKSDGTARDATLSTGFAGTTVAGVISKTKYATFVYDGSKFVHVATNQVD
jgi:hypothetical protein